MIQLLFLALLIQSIFAIDRCPGKRTSNCAGVSKTSNCDDYYEFSWNSTTKEPTARPKLCYAPSSGTKCATRASTYCEPPCDVGGKVGAPSANQWNYIIDSCYAAYEDLGLCESVYVDDEGDRWCYKIKTHLYLDEWGCTSPTWTCHN